MEVIAPLACNDAAWSALPRHPRAPLLADKVLMRMLAWTHWRLPWISKVHLDRKPVDILWRIWAGRSYVVITYLEEHYILKFACLDEWVSKPMELKVTAIPLSEGAFDICIERSLSNSDLHPAVKIELYDSRDQTTTVICEDVRCFPGLIKFIVPKGVHEMAEKAEWSTKQANYMSYMRKAGLLRGPRTFGCALTDAINYQKLHSKLRRRNGDSGSELEDSFKTYLRSSFKTYLEDSKLRRRNGDMVQQQHKQQQEGSPATIVDPRPSEVRLTDSTLNDRHRASRWETDTGAMKLLDAARALMLCGTICGIDDASGRMASLNEQLILKDPCSGQLRGDAVVPVIKTATEQKGEPELSSVFGDSHVTAQDSIFNTPLGNTLAAAVTTWIVGSAAPHHATGNRALLSDFTQEHSEIVLFGGDAGAMPMQVVGRGAVVTETMVLPDVWYVPGLAANLVSVSQLADLDYSVAFGRGKCYIRSTVDGAIIGAAHAGEDGLFTLDFLRVPLGL